MKIHVCMTFESLGYIHRPREHCIYIYIFKNIYIICITYEFHNVNYNIIWRLYFVALQKRYKKIFRPFRFFKHAFNFTVMYML